MDYGNYSKGGKKKVEVKNLYLQNDALLVKQLEKFYKADVPWVHLIWST